VSASAVRWLPAVAVLALALVPWSGNPFYRLAGSEGDGPDPTFDVPLDPAPLREARLPDDLPYVTEAPGASPLVQGNLKAAGQLYLSAQLPVQDRRRADVRVVYRDGRIVLVAHG
jgi:hypothetical protein